MTAIDDVSTNDMNFKHLDTSKDIVITPRNEFGGNVLLNTAHTWTAKVSDGNNYVGDYPVTLESNSIVVNSADFTNLPAGYYHLEIWEEWIDSTSTKQRSIYPSPQRTIDFTIYQNVTDLAEKEIKTIGFQDVVDQAVMNIGMNYVFKVNTIEPDQTATVVQAAADGKNYVTFNIPRGYKGDTGATGPQGPQGDKGDKGDKGDPGDNGFYHYMVDLTDPKYDRNKWYYVNANSNQLGSLGGPSYFSLEAPLGSGINVPYGNHSSGPGKDACARQTVLYGQSVWGSYDRKLIVLDDQNPKVWMTDGKRLLTFAVPNDNTLTYAFYARGGLKINITSDVPGLVWTPQTDTLVKNGATIPVLNDAPDPKALGLDDDHTFWALPMSQFLTKSDYAKIKAAIVALGGSLS